MKTKTLKNKRHLNNSNHTGKGAKQYNNNDVIWTIKTLENKQGRTDNSEGCKAKPKAREQQ